MGSQQDSKTNQSVQVALFVPMPGCSCNKYRSQSLEEYGKEALDHILAISLGEDQLISAVLFHGCPSFAVWLLPFWFLVGFLGFVYLPVGRESVIFLGLVHIQSLHLLGDFY